MFWRKKNLDSDEYRRIFAEVANLAASLNTISSKVALLEEKFLSRIKAQRLEKIKSYEEEQEEVEEELDPTTLQRRLLGFK